MDATQVKDKYTGEIAAQYEERRKNSDRWDNEQEVVELLLDKLMTDTDIQTILDIPVGTGRFFDIYSENNLEIIGADISEDMLERAATKADEFDMNITFQTGNILEPENIDANPDLVVCIRLLNWFSFEEVAETLRNIRSMGAEYAIVGVRIKTKENMSTKRKCGCKFLIFILI